MDRGAWQATVQGVAESWTQLKHLKYQLSIITDSLKEKNQSGHHIEAGLSQRMTVGSLSPNNITWDKPLKHLSICFLVVLRVKLFVQYQW